MNRTRELRDRLQWGVKPRICINTFNSYISTKKKKKRRKQMNFNSSPRRKSLGKLSRGEKTKPNSPDMLGQLKLQVDDFWPALNMARQNGAKEIICPFAAWVNGEPGEQYLVAELQPPYRPKPKPVENVITVEQFLTDIQGEQDDQNI
jgi:hypothetical protein